MKRPSRSSVHCAWILLALAGAGLAGEPVYEAAVATDHPEASRVGSAVLSAGGNAVDAAIATAFALGVVRPDSSGLGGGGFMVFRRGSDGHCVALDFRETAPAAARADMFVRQGKVVPGLSETGGLAVAVPGEAPGLELAHRLHGRLPWGRLLDGAIALARDGYPLTGSVHELLAAEKPLMDAFPAIPAAYYGSVPVPGAGTIVKNPGLAATLAAISSEGARAITHGPIAADIARACRNSGGILTEADLAGYRPVVRQPLRGTYRDLDILTMPPPSSGGVVILETLNTLSCLRGWPAPEPALYHHLLVEALRHGFADRAAHLGDPDFVRVPVRRLTSRAYARMLAERIDPSRAMADDRVGGPSDDHGTSHLCVVDANGDAVAMTLTINTTFGSRVVVRGRGFVLNNEMDDFAAAPGAPNAFGLIQGTTNAIVPGKRPLSSMSPTIVVKDRRAVIVAGASGGPHIITGTLQAILNVVDRGMPAGEAIAEPRVHHQWRPDQVKADVGLSQEVERGLVARGHRVVRKAPFNAVQIVVSTPRGLQAVGDPRKGGAGAGVPVHDPEVRAR